MKKGGCSKRVSHPINKVRSRRCFRYRFDHAAAAKGLHQAHRLKAELPFRAEIIEYDCLSDDVGRGRIIEFRSGVMLAQKGLSPARQIEAETPCSSKVTEATTLVTGQNCRVTSAHEGAPYEGRIVELLGSFDCEMFRTCVIVKSKRKLGLGEIQSRVMNLEFKGLMEPPLECDESSFAQERVKRGHEDPWDRGRIMRLCELDRVVPRAIL